MKLVIDETWEDIIDLCHSIEIEEISLEISENGVEIKEVDPSRVFLAKAELEELEDSTGIMDYEDREPAFDTEKLYNVLDSYDGSIIMEIKEGTAHFSSLEEDTHTAEIGMISREEEEFPEPDPNFTVSVDEVDIKDHINTAEGIVKRGKHPQFETIDGTLYMIYEGDVDRYEGLLGESDGEDISASYSSDYLGDVEGLWDIKMGDDIPIRGEREIEGDVWRAKTVFLLAPRVETEEE